MDSLDPNFARIADAWMKVLIEDFGTDHWYQLDGYFNGGTAPWLAHVRDGPSKATAADVSAASVEFIQPDSLWLARGAAAYRGMNRTDPKAASRVDFAGRKKG